MGSTTDVAPGKHVVIVGAGFAGLHCAMTLARDQDVRVTIIDRNNYQQFQPLLYQVATGLLSAESAAFNLRSIFGRQANVDVHISEIVSVNPETRSATGRNGDVYQGDYLVPAAGTEANLFNIPGVAGVRIADVLLARRGASAFDVIWSARSIRPEGC
jgi:NADH dehydrogenase